MIDFTRATLLNLAIHQVGCKGLGEELIFSQNPHDFSDDFVKETLLKYFLSPFSTDVYYQFKGKIDISLNSVANYCEDLFSNRSKFMAVSKNIAEHLYDQSMHPKIRGGSFYLAYFKDVMCDGELLDCIGIFKTEKQETFLKVDVTEEGGAEILCDAGIDISSLDRGALVFNTNKNKGYKISIIEKGKSVAETALYWSEDFLNARLLPNGYFHTKNKIDAFRSFVEEVLTEANNVDRMQQAEVFNRGLRFLNEREKFNQQEFEKEALVEEDLVKEFKKFEEDYQKRMDVIIPEDFDISETAIKKNKKYLRQVLKLDQNFHVYIHGRYDYIEEGFDEGKGLKFLKLHYVNKD